MHRPHTKEELANLVNDRSVNLASIDTSLITDMSMLFRFSDRTDFAGIENWDVSSVTDMAYMFCGVKSFNHPLNDWDVSNVTDMAYMFCGAEKFNQSLNDWDVSSVADMTEMFSRAKSFNQSLNDWDVSSVKNADCMFKNARGYDGSMKKWKFSDSMDHEPEDFIKGCFMWTLLNSCNDLPLIPFKQRKVSPPKQKIKFNVL